MVYYPQISVLVVTDRSILGRFTPEKIRVSSIPTHLSTSKVILDCWISFNFASN